MSSTVIINVNTVHFKLKSILGLRHQNVKPNKRSATLTNIFNLKSRHPSPKSRCYLSSNTGCQNSPLTSDSMSSLHTEQPVDRLPLQLFTSASCHASQMASDCRAFERVHDSVPSRGHIAPHWKKLGPPVPEPEHVQSVNIPQTMISNYCLSHDINPKSGSQVKNFDSHVFYVPPTSLNTVNSN